MEKVFVDTDVCIDLLWASLNLNCPMIELLKTNKK
jgi:hypothetical protein